MKNTEGEPVVDLAILLASLAPVLNPGVFVFVRVDAGTDLTRFHPLATFAEQEGVTLIIKEEEARQAGMSPRLRAAWITLRVHSDLHAVGLTAAVSGALAAAGISCNVFAAVQHDHLFVPIESGLEALTVLRALQRQHQHVAPPCPPALKGG